MGDGGDLTGNKMSCHPHPGLGLRPRGSESLHLPSLLQEGGVQAGDGLVLWEDEAPAGI